MNKYDRIAGEVENLLSQISDIESDKLATVSAEYTAAVSEINERLRKAVALLHKGLRDEALQECEREPNLLDAFESLDIHEQEVWRSMHRSLRVPLPPPLLLQQAAELNGAYALQAPLTELLRKHRLLALGHAPLEHRIQILRQISQKDPTSEIWHTDIKAYETERLAEIKSSFSKYRQKRDLPAIQALYREIHSDERIVPAPDELKVQVAEWLHELEIAAARDKLRDVSQRLMLAFSEFDIERATELQEMWELYLRPAKLPPEDDLLIETQPALDWLDEQRREKERQEEREALLSRLEQLLDDDTSDRNELESTYGRLSSTDIEVSHVLMRRYRNRLQSIQTREQRSQTLKLVGIVGAILICGTAVFAGLRGLQHATRVHEATSLLGTHRTNRQWQEGLGFITTTEQMSPYVFKSTSFQNEKTKFQMELESDKSRLSDFASLDEDIQIGGVTIEDATKISRMGDIAITEEEKQQVAELKRQMELHDAEKEANAKTAFNEAIDKINQQFLANANWTPPQLESLLRQIQQARQDHPYALRGRQQSVSDHDEVLEERIQRKRNELKKEEQLSITFDKIDESLSRSLDVYTALLSELATSLGESEAGQELSEVLKEKPFWVQRQKLNKALSPLPEKIERTSLSQANQATQRLKQLRKDQDLPQELEKLEQHLVAIARRPSLIRIDSLVPKQIRSKETASVTEPLLKIYGALNNDSTKWETAFRNAFSTILKNESVDALQRLRLFEVAVNRAIDGSKAYAAGFGDIQKLFQTEEMQSIIQSQSSQDASVFLTELPLKQANQRHVDAVKELRKIATRARWVGWVALNRDDSRDTPLSCHVRPETPDGTLFVIETVGEAKANSESEDKPTLQRLGTLRNGTVGIDKPAVMKLGRPVYWMK